MAINKFEQKELLTSTKLNALVDALNSLQDDVNGIYGELDKKQELLVSGSNIKTINNVSILGSGNLSFEGIDSPTENPVFLVVRSTEGIYGAKLVAKYAVETQVVGNLSVGNSKYNMLINIGKKESEEIGINNLPNELVIGINNNILENTDGKYKYVLQKYYYGGGSYQSFIYDADFGQVMYVKNGQVLNTIDNPTSEKEHVNIRLKYYKEGNSYYISAFADKKVASDLTFQITAPNAWASGATSTIESIIYKGNDVSAGRATVGKVTTTSMPDVKNLSPTSDDKYIYSVRYYDIVNDTTGACVNDSCIYSEDGSEFDYEGLFVNSTPTASETETVNAYLVYTKPTDGSNMGKLKLVVPTDKKPKKAISIKVNISGIEETYSISSGSSESTEHTITLINEVGKMPSVSNEPSDGEKVYKVQKYSLSDGTICTIYKSIGSPYTYNELFSTSSNAKPGNNFVDTSTDDSVSTISIQGTTSVNVESNTASYFVVDQDGRQISNVTWRISEGATYASIDKDTGKLTVKSGASGSTVKINAVCSGFSTTYTISVTYNTPAEEPETPAVPTVTNFSIVGGSTINVAGNVGIYTAKCTEYGTLENVVWEITSGSEYANITVNNGTAYINVKSGASASSVTIKAYYGSNLNITATKTISVTYNSAVVNTNEFDYTEVAKIVNPYCILYRSGYSDGTNGRYFDGCHNGYTGKVNSCLVLVPNATNEAQPWIDSSSNTSNAKHSDNANYRMLKLDSSVNKLVLTFANQYYNSDRIWESIVDFYVWSTGNDYIQYKQLHDNNGKKTYTIDIASLRETATSLGQDGTKLWIAIRFDATEQGLNLSSLSETSDVVLPLSSCGITIKGYTDYASGTSTPKEKINNSIYFCWDDQNERIKLVADYVPTSNVSVKYKIGSNGEEQTITITANNYESSIVNTNSGVTPTVIMPNWATNGALISEDDNYKYVLATWSLSPGESKFGVATFDKTQY